MKKLFSLFVMFTLVFAACKKSADLPAPTPTVSFVDTLNWKIPKLTIPYAYMHSLDCLYMNGSLSGPSYSTFRITIPKGSTVGYDPGIKIPDTTAINLTLVSETPLND